MGSIFYGTHLQRTRFIDGDRGTPHISNFWLPVEEAYTYNFQYSYSVSQEELQSLNNLWMAKGFRGSSVDTPTVILDHKGARRMEHRPSHTPISFSVMELLDLAGHSDWLDEEQPKLGTNHLERTGLEKGPLGRLTGLEIDVKLNCYSSRRVPRHLHIDDWHGSVCSAQIQSAPPSWVFKDNFWHRGDAYYYTRLHGIKVNVKTQGEIFVFDFPTIFEYLVECIVLIEIPKRLCGVLASYCLGKLSKVYAGVLVERFDLSQYFATSVMKFLCAIKMHEWLADSNQGISLMHMSELVGKASRSFGTAEFEAADIAAFNKYTFRVGCDIRGNGYTNYSKRASVARRIVSITGPTSTIAGWLRGLGWSRQSDNTVHSQHHIPLSEFLVASFHNERIALDDMVELFSRKRRPSLLERFFQAGVLRDHWKASSGTVEDTVVLPDNSSVPSQICHYATKNETIADEPGHPDSGPPDEKLDLVQARQAQLEDTMMTFRLETQQLASELTCLREQLLSVVQNQAITKFSQVVQSESTEGECHKRKHDENGTLGQDDSDLQWVTPGTWADDSSSHSLESEPPDIQLRTVWLV